MKKYTRKEALAYCGIHHNTFLKKREILGINPDHLNLYTKKQLDSIKAYKIRVGRPAKIIGSPQT